jgi:hypothetical protein
MNAKKTSALVGRWFIVTMEADCGCCRLAVLQGRVLGAVGAGNYLVQFVSNDDMNLPTQQKVVSANSMSVDSDVWAWTFYDGEFDWILASVKTIEGLRHQYRERHLKQKAQR